jgi:hypothetical protein
VASDAFAAMQQAVRDREQMCVDALLELYRFRTGDYLSETLPIVDGKWGLDLFNPQSLAEFGVDTGEGAAAGALTGLAIDAITGGMTLGAAAATGAVVGALAGAAVSRGRKLYHGLRGYTEMRVDDATINVLAMRQLALARALLRRGHASTDRIRLEGMHREIDKAPLIKRLQVALRESRRRPEWSHLARPDTAVTGGRCAIAKDRLVSILREGLDPLEFKDPAVSG